MARRRHSATLTVLLNGRRVGETHRSADGDVDFRYLDEWLNWEFTQPISLSLPLREDRYTGAPVTAVFDNLLPDNADIRRRVAEQVGADGVDPFSLLAAIGRDCAGALQFLPEGAEPTPGGAIDAVPVSDADIAALIDNLPVAPLGLRADDEFRISVAGAQEKTALLWWNGQWHKPHGTTPTTHILKPQIGQLPNGIDLSNSVENEYFCLRLLRELGLPTTNAEITDFQGQRVLVVERFDRQLVRDGRLLRRPQEDACQALSIPSTRKYESEGGPGVAAIMRLLAASDTPDLDRRRFFTTIVAFWLLGTTDGHAKNFSIFLLPGGRFAATPLYDVLSAQPSADAGQVTRRQMRLAMAIGDRRRYRVDEIVPQHFLQTAKRAGYAEHAAMDCLQALKTDGARAVERTIAALPRDFPAAVSDPTASGIQRRLALIE